MEPMLASIPPMDVYSIYRYHVGKQLAACSCSTSIGGNGMAPLQNSAIEYPERMFDVELVIFGTLTRAAAKRTIKVLAQTGKGAQKICKWRYRRSEIKSTRAVPEPGLLFAQTRHAMEPLQPVLPQNRHESSIT